MKEVCNNWQTIDAQNVNKDSINDLGDIERPDYIFDRLWERGFEILSVALFQANSLTECRALIKEVEAKAYGADSAEIRDDVEAAFTAWRDSLMQDGFNQKQIKKKMEAGKVQLTRYPWYNDDWFERYELVTVARDAAIQAKSGQSFNDKKERRS